MRVLLAAAVSLAAAAVSSAGATPRTETLVPPRQRNDLRVRAGRQAHHLVHAGRERLQHRARPLRFQRSAGGPAEAARLAQRHLPLDRRRVARGARDRGRDVERPLDAARELPARSSTTSSAPEPRRARSANVVSRSSPTRIAATGSGSAARGRRNDARVRRNLSRLRGRGRLPGGNGLVRHEDRGRGRLSRRRPQNAEARARHDPRRGGDRRRAAAGSRTSEPVRSRSGASPSRERTCRSRSSTPLSGHVVSSIQPQGTPVAIGLSAHVLAALERTPLGLRLAWYSSVERPADRARRRSRSPRARRWRSATGSSCSTSAGRSEPSRSPPGGSGPSSPQPRHRSACPSRAAGSRGPRT